MKGNPVNYIFEAIRFPDLRKKILFILGVLVIFRIMANIPIPGVNVVELKRFFEQFQFFGILGAFTGGSFDNLSIAMLGLGPYITAVIILQLLTMVIPSLEKMYKEEGEEGRRKFNQYARMLTVPLAALQGYGMILLLKRQGVIVGISTLDLVSSIFVITAGTIFLMWLGELITERGIGNGISILIFAGIAAMIPSSIRQLIVTWDPSQLPYFIIFLVMVLLIITAVVLVNEGRRNIPISYARQVRGRRLYGGVSTYLPININPAGVIPIIFALSILFLPTVIATLLAGFTKGGLSVTALNVANFFQRPVIRDIFYFTLVFAFTFFYTMVTFDPKSIAQNLQKMGGFIPGIRPGEQTARFLKKVLYRILPFGALFLGLIAIMPSIIAGLTNINVFAFFIGGTSVLIIVSVIMEILKQLKSQLQMRTLERF